MLWAFSGTHPDGDICVCRLPAEHTLRKDIGIISVWQVAVPHGKRVVVITCGMLICEKVMSLFVILVVCCSPMPKFVDTDCVVK